MALISARDFGIGTTGVAVGATRLRGALRRMRRAWILRRFRNPPVRLLAPLVRLRAVGWVFLERGHRAHLRSDVLSQFGLGRAMYDYGCGGRGCCEYWRRR